VQGFGRGAAPAAALILIRKVVAALELTGFGKVFPVFMVYLFL
jgi:hypothetical protein